MYNQRILYGLDNFILKDYFLAMEHEYHLKEEKESGKSELIVRVENENLCIYNFDGKRKCNFLREEKVYGMQKSVDHMIFSKEENNWKLHLIEMKSSVGGETWKNIKQLILKHKEIKMKRSEDGTILEGMLEL